MSRPSILKSAIHVSPSEKALFGKWDAQRREELDARQSEDRTPVAPGRFSQISSASLSIFKLTWTAFCRARRRCVHYVLSHGQHMED